MNYKDFKHIYGLTFTELNNLVTAEVASLKVNATKYEIDRLNFSKLDTTSRSYCVYGQMTGDCFSSRATTLIKQSCERVFKATYGTKLVEGRINGSPSDKNRDDFWSPIEIFIDQPRNKKNGNNERLIKYLKGETDVLNLK